MWPDISIRNAVIGFIAATLPGFGANGCDFLFIAISVSLRSCNYCEREMTITLKAGSTEGGEKAPIERGNGAARWRPQMQTKTTIAAVILAATVALAGTAEAGKFDGIFHPSGSSGPSKDIGDVFHNTDNKPVITKHIDIDPPKPMINKYIDIGVPDASNAGTPGGAGAPGTGNPGLNSYPEVAKLNIGLRLNCAVAGTPVEFPDDLVIANAGLIELAAGTQIQWQVAAAGQSGIAVLAKTLRPGKSLKLNGVLAGGVQIGTPCAIVAIGH
jgi:hypothetical protein